jgi:hypothetical protein
VKHFGVPVLAILFAVGILTVGDVMLKRVSAITCVRPNILGRRDSWPVGATVNVNISNFPQALQPCVKSAFDSWNSADSNDSNTSSVKFQYVFNNTEVVTGTVGGQNVYQITYEQTTDVNGNAVTIPADTLDTSNASATNLKSAKTQINPNVTACSQITQVTAHEIGHTLGLDDCAACTQPQTSVMVGIPCKIYSGSVCILPDWNNTANGLPAPTSCDNGTVNSVYLGCVAATFACSTGLPCCGQTVCSSGTCTACQSDCPSPPKGCIQCGSSPVILDLDGKGFHLTSATNGVIFDISGTGKPIQMGWTAKGVSNAFLALPGPDGLVHDGKQLFGNFTPQPSSDLVNPNGFAALAVYDDPKNGGNGDGVIDSRDQVFASLRLWIDVNHDGVSQPSELFTLPSQGVNSISLTYREAKKEDQFGNRFRYEARVNPDDSGASQVDRKAYDVFFVTGGSCPVPGTAPTTQSVFPAQGTGSLFKP